MRTQTSPEKRLVSGFTLIELLVVIAIIAILAAILFPVYAQMKEKARQANCQSNLKQLVIAALSYTDDYDGHFPPYCYWNFKQYWCGYLVAANELDVSRGLLMPYIKTGQLQVCPSARPSTSTKYGTSYGYNIYYIGSDVSITKDWNHFPGVPAALGDLTQPSKTVIFADAEVDYGGSGGLQEYFALHAPSEGKPTGIAYRHNGKVVAAFCDGHVSVFVKGTLERNSPIQDEYFRR